MIVGKKERINIYDVLLIVALDMFIIAAYFKGYSILAGLEPRKLVVVVGGLVLAPVIMLLPRLSLVLLFIFCSFAQANIHLSESFDLSFVDIFTVGLTGSILLHLLFGTIDFRLPSPSILILTGLLAGFGLIVWLYHYSYVSDPGILAFNIKNMLVLILLFLIIASTLHSEELLRYVFYAVLLSVLISSIWALASFEDFDLWAAIRGQSAARISNYAFYHANILGQFLVLTLPFAFFAIVYAPSALMQVVGFWAGVAGSIALLLTFSRSSWLATVGGILLVALRNRRSVFRLVLAMLGFYLIIEILSQILLNVSLYELLSERFGELQESDFSRRPFIWSAALHIIAQHPILGVGPGFFSDAYFMEMEVTYRRLHAHNTFLTIAAEWGIIFCAIFIAWFGSIVLKGLRFMSEKLSPSTIILTQSLMAGLFGLTFVMIFEHTFFAPLVSSLFFMLCGVVIAIENRIKKHEDTVLRP